MPMLRSANQIFLNSRKDRKPANFRPIRFIRVQKKHLPLAIFHSTQRAAYYPKRLSGLPRRAFISIIGKRANMRYWRNCTAYESSRRNT